ncbi:MAG: hypothetical protein AAF696_30820 [Bacteroidota bacterium]
MKTLPFKTLLLASIFSVFLNHAYAQDKLQIGLNGIGIIYPGIEANGFAIYGQVGKLVFPNLLCGIKPFFGQVRFNVNGPFSERNRSIGINAFVKLFFLRRSKSSLYFTHSFGVGGLSYRSAFSREGTPYLDNTMVNFTLGLGSNVNLTERMHLEFNIEYLNMRNVRNPGNTTIGNTIIPTLGLLFDVEN